MDPKQREHLQENDLAHALFHFNEFWNKYGTYVLLVVLIITVLIVGRRLINQRIDGAHEAAWSDLAATSSPAGYQEIAQAYDDDAVRALALLRGGDLLLQEASAPSGDADAQQRTTTLNDAASRYQAVIDEPGFNEVFKLNARLGLAAVNESKRQFDLAAEQYDAVAKSAGKEYPAIAQSARARLALLDRLRQPIAFAPEPVPLPPVAPQTLPDVSPSDLAPITPDAAVPAQAPAPSPSEAPATPEPAAPAPAPATP